ncbi:UNVERIFIED_ORG: hypothetical protein GGE44_004263 [Rhizobium esperanzae]
MTDDTTPPPWPDNDKGKSLLADWVQDRLADTYEELYGDEPEIVGLLASEQALLIHAFETKEWAGVATRLRDPAATRAFVGVVADLIELNAMTNGAQLLWDSEAFTKKKDKNRKKKNASLLWDGKGFADRYTLLKRRDDLVTIRDWLVIDQVLRRSYPEIEAEGKGKKIETMASWLTAVLRGTEPGRTDEDLYRERIDYIESLKEDQRKAGLARTGSPLARLVHSVLTAIVTDGR